MKIRYLVTLLISQMTTSGISSKHFKKNGLIGKVMIILQDILTLLLTMLTIHLRVDLSFLYKPLNSQVQRLLFYSESALAIASALSFLLSLSTWLYTLLVVPMSL